jgi:hypothetical protein
MTSFIILAGTAEAAVVLGNKLLIKNFTGTTDAGLYITNNSMVKVSVASSSNYVNISNTTSGVLVMYMPDPLTLFGPICY